MVMMWMDFEWNATYSQNGRDASTLFWWSDSPRGLSDGCVRGKSFFIFLRITQTNAEFPVGKSGF
jgi:hypothetical protein